MTTVLVAALSGLLGLLIGLGLALKPLARLSAQTMAAILRQMILAETPRYHQVKFGRD